MKTRLWFCIWIWGVAACAFATDVTPLLARAHRAREAGRMDEARGTLLRARQLSETNADPEVRAKVEAQLGEVNLLLLKSRHPQPESEWVTVRPGDTLGRIASRHGTTVELLRASNDLTGDNIRSGQRLKVLNQSFTVHINKERNELELRLGDRFFKRYSVSTGEGGNTPVGSFEITDRIVHPDWWHPEDGRRIPYGDPEHRIGTHWLGWNRRGFGIHGTDEPEKIGQSVSLGCVRMLNEEVGELYLLLPRGTQVTVE